MYTSAYLIIVVVVVVFSQKEETKEGGGGRWFPWLPETAAAANDDARGVTDSWLSYRVHTYTHEYPPSPPQTHPTTTITTTITTATPSPFPRSETTCDVMVLVKDEKPFQQDVWTIWMLNLIINRRFVF
ncbi:hypothetical protein M0804_005031 [Polistes exclamans]|nr:hypothetical protein M0804_005031 [Polistes exclamans]